MTYAVIPILKVPIIYFFEDYKEFKDVGKEDLNDDLNYSFLSRTFSSYQKFKKINLQILNNTSKIEKLVSLAPR